MVWWLIALKAFKTGAERLQKHSSRFSLQFMQLSTISKPYGVFMFLLATRKQFVRNPKPPRNSTAWGATWGLVRIPRFTALIALPGIPQHRSTARQAEPCLVHPGKQRAAGGIHEADRAQVHLHRSLPKGCE